MAEGDSHSRKSSVTRFLLMALGVFGLVSYATAKKACPVRNPNFETESGVEGAIMDGPGNPNVMYYFGPGGWPKNLQQCARACKQWPSPKGVLLTPRNGEQGPCAYWAWMGGDGCYLFGCGVCRNFNSFVPTSELPPSKNGETYCAGGGPGRKQCKGEIKGDPHYTGGDRSHFDFTGVPGKHYCLISDSHLHVNVYYGGRYEAWGNDTHKALTWIRKVGIMWGNHSVVMEAREGGEWRYEQGYMSRLLLDGREVRLAKEGDRDSTEDGLVEVSWFAAKQGDADDEVDVYHLSMGKTVKMVATLRPEVEHLRTEDDGIVHFTLDFPELVLTENAHGVLGQTYRPDHRERISQQEMEFSELLKVDVVKGENAQGFLDGRPKDYVASGLLNDDCAVARFDHSFATTTTASNDASGEKAYIYRKLLR